MIVLLKFRYRRVTLAQMLRQAISYVLSVFKVLNDYPSVEITSLGDHQLLFSSSTETVLQFWLVVSPHLENSSKTSSADDSLHNIITAAS